MKIRDTVRQMIDDGISVESILAAHGNLVSVDEAELLKKYEQQHPPQKKEKHT